jgi:RNA polymerase sigma-70 factor, ECF subfamily
MALSEPDVEAGLLQRLREGNEEAFGALVDRYHGAMIRFARGFVRDQAVAEEVAQDAWLGVLNGLADFAGRSSLKSWIFAIVANKAKTRAGKEARSIPFSAMAAREVSGAESAVDPGRFLGPDAQWPGHWARPPQSWGDRPEERLLGQEMMQQLTRILEGLPPAQRMVITLRDVEGHDAKSVCNILGVTETNMRVLLHRARSRVRGQLERSLADAPERPGLH